MQLRRRARRPAPLRPQDNRLLRRIVAMINLKQRPIPLLQSIKEIIDVLRRSSQTLDRMDHSYLPPRPRARRLLIHNAAHIVRHLFDDALRLRQSEFRLTKVLA